MPSHKFVSTNRRQFLRATGVAFALPLLGAAAEAPPRRFLGICNNLGLLGEHFFPAPGAAPTSSPYLQHLAPFQNDITTFANVWLPDVDGSHNSEVCFLTGAPHPSNGGFRNTISLDQYLAEHIGVETRFPSLTLGVNVMKSPRSLSWTGSGVMIPCEDSAAQLYRRLFLQGSAAEIERQIERLRLGQSIMDSVAGEAQYLSRNLASPDRARLDQYMTGVRELERRLVLAQAWEKKPKPAAPAPEPKDPGDPRFYMQKVRLMYDMARLAFATDSTRLITLFLDSVNSPAIEVEGTPITDGYHNLSHHGKNPSKLTQLAAIDHWHMKLLAELLGNLKSAQLLDHTIVLYGSNFGDANKHTTNDLPAILAGGGFRHGKHLTMPGERNYPLSNLYLSILHRFGIEAKAFSSAQSTFTGLELSGS
ncbi:MAG: DUF1552 domain-containing protein [Bryobacter sp.]|nr:DUF1552 domain-containing protein [Bryobacter sp.]